MGELEPVGGQRQFWVRMPSTAIRTLSYDDETQTLFVTFIDGDIYAYFDVPPRVYREFRVAASKGGFFARSVRGDYRYQRLPSLPSMEEGEV